jgi:hypothetical protein
VVLEEEGEEVRGGEEHRTDRGDNGVESSWTEMNY